MKLICFDVEGVFTPEVWIQVASENNIDELRLTTRDEPDYDKLMTRRLEILQEHKITLSDIQAIIAKMDLLPGAKEFLDWVRERTMVVLLSDTFIEFGMHFMKQLGYPTMLCHDLSTDENGMIISYNIRIPDQKRKSVQAFKKLNYNVLAAGDSYNDTTMLKEADCGILFRPSDKTVKDFPQFPAVNEYNEMKSLIDKWLNAN